MVYCTLLVRRLERATHECCLGHKADVFAALSDLPLSGEKRTSCGCAMLSLMLGFVRFKITNPCIFSEPLMCPIAMWTVGLAEKYRARAEGRGFHIFAGRNCSPGL